MPSITCRISGSFDGSTVLNTATAILTPIAGSADAYSLSNIVNLGVINLKALNGMITGPGGLLNGSAARIVYVEYSSGAATSFTAFVGIDLSGSTPLQQVSPSREVNPATASPPAVFDLAAPSLDHSLVLTSNAAPGVQEIVFHLQVVDPSSNFEADFTADASTPAEGAEVFSSTIATAALTIPLSTIQRYNASGGAFAVNTPSADTLNGRFGVKECAGSITALTVTATSGTTIENLDGVIGATAVITQADVCVMWQLDPNVGGANPIWRVIFPTLQESVLLVPAADAAVAILRTTGGMQLTVTGAGNVAISTTSSFAGQVIDLFAVAVAGGGSYTLALSGGGTLTLNATGEGATVMRNTANTGWVCTGLSGATIV